MLQFYLGKEKIWGWMICCSYLWKCSKTILFTVQKGSSQYISSFSFSVCSPLDQTFIKWHLQILRVRPSFVRNRPEAAPDATGPDLPLSCTHPLTLSPSHPFHSKEAICCSAAPMFGSSQSSELCQRHCKPHTRERAASHYSRPLLVPPRKRLPTRPGEPAPSEPVVGESALCLMASAHWGMGHKFKRRAELAESPARLSPTHAQIQAKSLLRARLPGPHPCECLKALFFTAIIKQTFHQTWLSLCGRTHVTIDDWRCLSSNVLTEATLSVLVPAGAAAQRQSD